MLRVPAILLLTLVASPAFAGATAWQELLPGVKARLISSDVVADGRVLAGFELDLPAGSKTYWRNPGETGIPPILDFSASSGLANPEVAWPLPIPERDQGYLDYVYRGHLVLPVRLAVSGPSPSLVVKATLGICSDVCVPASASFVLPLDATRPDEGQGIRLDQALAEVPAPWDGPQPAVGVVSLAVDGKALLIRDLNPEIEPSSVIAEVGDPSVLVDLPQKSPESAIWTLPVLGGAPTMALAGQAITLTFATARGPFSITTSIAAGTAPRPQ